MYCQRLVRAFDLLYVYMDLIDYVTMVLFFYLFIMHIENKCRGKGHRAYLYTLTNLAQLNNVMNNILEISGLCFIRICHGICFVYFHSRKYFVYNTRIL